MPPVRVGRSTRRPTGPSPPAAELEFQAAIQEYRRISGRMFPTWSEVLEVAHGLGYRKPDGPSSGR